MVAVSSTSSRSKGSSSAFGVRATVAIGACMIAGGLALSSHGSLWALYVGHGLMLGLLGNGGVYPPLLIYVSRWFDRRRGTAICGDPGQGHLHRFARNDRDPTADQGRASSDYGATESACLQVSAAREHRARVCVVDLDFLR